MNTFTQRTGRLYRLLTIGAIAGTLTGLSLVAIAQGPGGPGRPGPGGFGGGFGRGRGQGGARQMPVAALPVTTLDTIVKLTPAQKPRVTQIHDRFAKEMAAMRPQPGQRPDPAVFQRLRDAGTKATAEIEAILTPAQKSKLAAARADFALYRLAGIPLGLYGQIGLTAAQKAQLQAIQKGLAGNRTAAPQPAGNRGGMREAMQAARQKGAAVLTPAQKAKVEKYLQAHPNERGFGRGGRGGGPGGPRA